jgi:hypothetical protein
MRWQKSTQLEVEMRLVKSSRATGRRTASLQDPAALPTNQLANMHAMEASATMPFPCRGSGQYLAPARNLPHLAMYSPPPSWCHIPVAGGGGISAFLVASTPHFPNATSETSLFLTSARAKASVNLDEDRDRSIPGLSGRATSVTNSILTLRAYKTTARIR